MLKVRKKSYQNQRKPRITWFMLGVIVGTKRYLDQKLREAEFLESTYASRGAVFGGAVFVVLSFGRLVIHTLRVLVSIPLHVRMSPQRAFEQLARRSPTGEFLDSYTDHLREQRHAVLSLVAVLVGAGLQLSALGFGLYQAVKPGTASAYSTTVSINPSWDASFNETQLYNDNFGGGCDVVTFNSCRFTGNLIMEFGRDQNLPGSCAGVFDYTIYYDRPAMKFSLSSIPNNATITNVELLVNVDDASTQGISIRRISDTPDTLQCDDGTGFASIASGTQYTSTLWNTTGLKTIDLGATADSDVQSRITGSDLLGIGVKATEDDANEGYISSVDSGTPGNRPVLRVTYTLPPQTPTGFAKTSVAPTTISWGWTDNATVETRYDVHDSSHTNVAGCTNLPSNTQLCTETGLSANTSYTRHPNVTDPHGNTDGSSASAYTAQNTPSSVNVDVSGLTSISVSAVGSFPNLTAGTSGLYFENTTRGTNSGWITTNSWNETGLTANTPYLYRVKARNGDGVETAFSTMLEGHTTAPAPDVTSSRLTSTWYNTPTFTFTNAAGFGAGAIEYYRVAWTQSSSYTFTGSEPQWTSGTVDQVASADSQGWYLHVRSYDGSDTPSGGEESYGPYYYDATAPVSPATVNDGSASDVDTTTSGDTLSANWTTGSDPTAGLARYEYAIGTTSGGTQVVGYTNVGLSTSVVRSGLVLTVGTTYYVAVRGVDLAGNIGSPTVSDGVTVQSASVPAPSGTTISNVTVIIGETAATVRWTTNEPATSKVNYGKTSAYGLAKASTKLVTTHSLQLTGLTKLTTYHFQVVSAGTSVVQTADDTFVTTGDASTINRAIGPTLFDPLVTDGSNPSMSFTGVAKGNQTVRVYVDKKLVKTLRTRGTAKQTKTIAFTISTAELAKGSHTLYAQSTDENGRTSIIRQRIKFTLGVTASAEPTLRLTTTSDYIVQPGDSLWSISQTFLGDGNRYAEIVSLNENSFPSLSSAAHIIQPGWHLELPAGRT